MFRMQNIYINLKKSSFTSRVFKNYVILTGFFLVVKVGFLIFYLKKSNFKNPDSEGYLILAKYFNLAYIENQIKFNDLALLRTPGYPLFISIFDSNYKLIILIQIILNIFNSIIIVIFMKKVLKIGNERTTMLVFILLQIENSLTVYSYRILTETLFTFLLLLFLCVVLYAVNLDKLKLNFKIFLIFLLISILMVRPIGIALLLVLISSLFFAKKRKILVFLIIFVFGINLLYATYNYYSKQVFTVSTVQNFYLFIYQGAASKAVSESQNFEIVATRESTLRDSVLGPNPNIADVNSYNQSRAWELISQNKIAFIKLNAIGIAKILLSPNRLEVDRITSDEGRIKYPDIIKFIFSMLAFISTFSISTLGIIGAIIYFRKKFEYKLLSITLIIFLLFASGANAYGRYRAPIAPILALYSGLIIVEFYNFIKLKRSNKNIQFNKNFKVQ